MSTDKNSSELPLQPESNGTAPMSYQSITPANDVEDAAQKNQIDPAIEKRLLRKIDLRYITKQQQTRARSSIFLLLLVLCRGWPFYT